MFETASELTHDWRFRTLVPVLVIHIVAFAILYAAMNFFAVDNLINTQTFGGAILLDEIEFNFRDSMLAQTRDVLRARLGRQAYTHHLSTINVYNAAAQVVGSTRGAWTDAELEDAREAFLRSGKATLWKTLEGNRTMLIGARPIPNAPACHSCHGPHAGRLGAIQIAIDLTDEVQAVRESVSHKFIWVGFAWLGLVIVVSGIRNKVIGRPLERINSSLTALTRRGGLGSLGSSGSSGRPPRNRGTEGTEELDVQDLDVLARRVNDTLWGVIQTQRAREADMARQMVRAEQLASLGELAAGLTHEIRNPIAGVVAALELLRSESRDNEEVLDQMIAELRRACDTVGALLRLARPQAPQRVELDMASVVREVGSLFTARLRRQGIALEIEIPGAVPVLPLDHRLMVQLLVNLLTNAMQATDRGGSIKVLLAPFPMHDGVVLAISDSGHGIPAAELGRVFDPFFTTKEAGTGLGLAICRQIVEQHGGTIDIESEVGKGTRIVVLLPDPNAEESEERDGAAAVG